MQNQMGFAGDQNVLDAQQRLDANVELPSDTNTSQTLRDTSFTSTASNYSSDLGQTRVVRELAMLFHGQLAGDERTARAKQIGRASCRERV